MCVSDSLKKCNDFHLRQISKIDFFFFIDSMAEVSTLKVGEILALFTSVSRYNVLN